MKPLPGLLSSTSFGFRFSTITRTSYLFSVTSSCSFSTQNLPPISLDAFLSPLYIVNFNLVYLNLISANQKHALISIALSEQNLIYVSNVSYESTFSIGDTHILPQLL